MHIEHLQQGIVVLVEQDRSASGSAEFHRPADVVDMRVGDDDLLHLQVVLAHKSQYVFNFIARIDHYRFARSLVSNDRAVALQRADRENFVDHLSIVASTELQVKSLATDSQGFPRMKETREI